MQPRHLRFVFLTVLFVLASAPAQRSGVFGQSVSSQKAVPTFHIQGTIESPWDSLLKGRVVARSDITFHGEQAVQAVGGEDSPYIAVPRTEVGFHGDHVDKTAVVDEKGFYQADLPIGAYKMAAEGPKFGGQALTPYVRFFRVDSPANIVVSGKLYLAPTNCDIALQTDTPEEQREEMKDACGGTDSFLLPSQKDGTPFEVFFRYPRRDLTRVGFVYTGSEKAPVFVAYNLFSLQATEVRYNAKHHAIGALGNVVVEDGSGATRHLASARFTFQDGVAAEFRKQLPRPSE